MTDKVVQTNYKYLHTPVKDTCKIVVGMGEESHQLCGKPASVMMSWNLDIPPLYLCADCYSKRKAPYAPPLEQLKEEGK